VTILSGKQSFKLTKTEPGYMKIERSIPSRLGITQPRVTDISPTRTGIMWEKRQTVGHNLLTGRVMERTAVSGGILRMQRGDIMGRRFNRVISARSGELPIIRLTKGTPTKGGGRIYKAPDILGSKRPQKGTIATGRGLQLMQRTKTEEALKIDTKQLLSTKSRQAGPQDILTRTRFNVGTASLFGTRSRQAQAFRTRQAFRTASLLGNVPVPALTTRSLLSSKQITRITTASRPEERLGLASPLLMPSRLRLAAPIMPGFGGGRSLGSPRLTFGRNYKYAPSLAGIFSGKTIRKAPKGTLTGLEIRYPVRRRI
jgi:hypothetical protein